MVIFLDDNLVCTLAGIILPTGVIAG